MKLVFLDRKTLGKDINLDQFYKLADVKIYQTTTAEQTLTRVKDADIVITNKVVIDKQIMEQSNIKLICITATGTDNVDIKYAKEKGIVVKNVAGYSTSSVAQVTIAHVLHFVQKLNSYIKYIEDENWERSDIFTYIDVPFHELKNKKWGIIGLGTIGTKVAQIAESFDCEVNYYSTSGKNNNTKYNRLTLEELMSTSDIITIHSPLTNTTYNMINKTYLNMMKEDAILVNVGRGGIINESDLAKKIDSDKSLYCGLDVLEHEPMKRDNPLNKIRNKDRIIITPHIAWGSVESRNRLIKMVFDNVKEYIV